MTNLIYLIGRSGTGKYTIAKEIAKHGYIIIDNQLINNPIFSLIIPDKLNSSATVPLEAWNAIAKIRNIVFDYLKGEKENNYILTNELFEDDDGDKKLFAQIAELARNRNSLFLPVKLLISEEENARRISSPGRLERFKSTKIDKKDKARQLIKPNHPNLLELEVSNLSAEKAAKIIISKLEQLS